jgi:hypothetical protein
LLDRVVGHGDRLLALVVLQAAQPGAAALVERIEVADLDLAAEQAGFVVAVELQMLGGGALTLSSSLSWQLC